MTGHASASSFGDAARALALVARTVAMADPTERLSTLRDVAGDLRAHVASGFLNETAVRDRIIEVAQLHNLEGAAEIENIARFAVEPPDDVDDPVIEHADEYPPIVVSQLAADALASWDRIMANSEQRLQAGHFLRAATEVLRLERPQASPDRWLQLIDYLHAMGVRHGVNDVAVQNMLVAATQAPTDAWSKDASATPTEGQGEPADDGPYFEADPVLAVPALDLVTPEAWRDVPLPPMRWVATNRIPASDATILSGDGGGGKTTVALQLAVSVERGLGDWLGTTCEQGPVIFFSAEEPENEMRRRVQRVARKRGLDPDEFPGLHFHFASPENCLLGVSLANGAMGPTPLFTSLAESAAVIRPALIIVDSVAGTFGGNQNDRVHARTFVGMFRRLAQDVDCAVLLLDHPSLSGITSGTGRGGSMDWQNATRARLHLETVTADDGSVGRVLEIKKSNYGPVGEPVKLRWEDGSFVIEGSVPAPQQAAAHASADQRYLECLDAMTTQGRAVFHAPGRGYAPRSFAAMPQANGMTWRAFQAAQERLFAAGVIENVDNGAKSKGSKRIARRA